MGHALQQIDADAVIDAALGALVTHHGLDALAGLAQLMDAGAWVVAVQVPTAFVGGDAAQLLHGRLHTLALHGAVVARQRQQNGGQLLDTGAHWASLSRLVRRAATYPGSAALRSS